MPENTQLNVIITGATGGIGRAVAEQFAKQFTNQEASLFLLGREQAKLDELKEALEQQHKVSVRTYAIELGAGDESEAAIEAFFKSYAKEVKQLDVLVNCAGKMPVTSLMMQKLSEVKACLDINLLSAIVFSKFASRLMMRNKKGSIINISSIVAHQGSAYQSVYAASKAGVEGFTKSLAKELAPMNIRVNAIAPGMVATTLLNELSEEKLQERIKQIPLGRLGNPDEVADACVFLASNNSSYVTGQVLSIDGGLQL